MFSISRLIKELEIDNTTKVIHVRLNTKVLSKLRDSCKKGNISKSEFIRNSLERVLES